MKDGVMYCALNCLRKDGKRATHRLACCPKNKALKVSQARGEANLGETTHDILEDNLTKSVTMAEEMGALQSLNFSDASASDHAPLSSSPPGNPTTSTTTFDDLDLYNAEGRPENGVALSEEPENSTQIQENKEQNVATENPENSDPPGKTFEFLEDRRKRTKCFNNTKEKIMRDFDTLSQKTACYGILYLRRGDDDFAAREARPKECIFITRQIWENDELHGIVWQKMTEIMESENEVRNRAMNGHVEQIKKLRELQAKLMKEKEEKEKLQKEMEAKEKRDSEEKEKLKNELQNVQRRLAELERQSVALED